MSIQEIGKTKKYNLPIYRCRCIKCRKEFGVVHTPIMDKRTVPCPRCRLWHTVEFKEGISLSLKAIVPYVYKD